MKLSSRLLEEKLVKIKAYLFHKVIWNLSSSLHIEGNGISILVGRWIHWILIGILALILILGVRKLISIWVWLIISLSLLGLLLSCIVPLTVAVVSWLLLLLLIPIGSWIKVIDSIIKHALSSALGITSDLVIIAVEAKSDSGCGIFCSVIITIDDQLSSTINNIELVVIAINIEDYTGISN